MSRVMAAFVALALLATSGVASAQTPPKADEPQADKPQADKPQADKPRKTAEPPAPALPRAPVLDPSRALPAPSATPGVDLFPERVLRRTATEGVGRNERRAGVSLGDDGDWRVQAAQIGAMAATFGALTALCGGGKCLVPKSWTSWLPDALQARPQVVPQIRKQQKLPQAR